MTNKNVTSQNSEHLIIIISSSSVFAISMAWIELREIEKVNEKKDKK
jgi:hypothetical protein